MQYLSLSYYQSSEDSLITVRYTQVYIKSSDLLNAKTIFPKLLLTIPHYLRLNFYFITILFPISFFPMVSISIAYAIQYLKDNQQFVLPTVPTNKVARYLPQLRLLQTQFSLQLLKGTRLTIGPVCINELDRPCHNKSFPLCILSLFKFAFLLSVILGLDNMIMEVAKRSPCLFAIRLC